MAKGNAGGNKVTSIIHGRFLTNKSTNSANASTNVFTSSFLVSIYQFCEVALFRRKILSINGIMGPHGFFLQHYALSYHYYIAK